jgi:hypothetical protein
MILVNEDRLELRFCGVPVDDILHDALGEDLAPRRTKRIQKANDVSRFALGVCFDLIYVSEVYETMNGVSGSSE